MSSRRVLKVAEAIREVVSMAILTELRDPRIQNVTVTRVEVSADLRQAKVGVSVMGDEQMQELSLHGLRNAAGFLQQKVSQRVDLRYTPRLKFQLDRGVKHSLEVARLLDELLPQEGESSDPAGSDPAGPDPADPALADPALVDPEPADPEPADPHAADPELADPEPAEEREATPPDSTAE